MNEGFTGLEWHEGINDRILIFGWTIPLITLQLLGMQRL